MFRRAFRRNLMRRGGAPAIPPALVRAHELMKTAQYPAAAEAFEQLARGAEERLHPKAFHLFLQAGRARLLAGQKEVGLKHIRHGMEMMARLGLNEPFLRSGGGIVRELNDRGMTSEAQEIAEWMKTVLPGAPALSVPAPAKNQPILPTTCPGCGGPLRSDEVDWIDEITAECNWCGGAVRTET